MCFKGIKSLPSRMGVVPTSSQFPLPRLRRPLKENSAVPLQRKDQLFNQSQLTHIVLCLKDLYLNQNARQANFSVLVLASLIKLPTLKSWQQFVRLAFVHLVALERIHHKSFMRNPFFLGCELRRHFISGGVAPYLNYGICPNLIRTSTLYIRTRYEIYSQKARA